jgi:hypothetical protein
VLVERADQRASTTISERANNALESAKKPEQVVE